jgi:NAD(P)-dependent dehydrogenase (short-subunit alcohol dehydrogenase family)
MTDRVEGKDVVITGADSGASRAFAVDLAREGVSAGGMVLV